VLASGEDFDLFRRFAAREWPAIQRTFEFQFQRVGLVVGAGELEP
jgi:hypothetical protein